MQKYCACHTERLLKRECDEVSRLPRKATFETFKSDHFCSIPRRHGHGDLMRTLANGCGLLGTVADGCERLRNV